MRKKTHEEYIAEVAIKNPNVEVIGQYINNNTNILHRCKIDDNVWMGRPSNILGGKGCPVCGQKKKAMSHKKTTQEYINDLLQNNPNIQVIEDYMGSNIKIKHRCQIDGNEWLSTPANILSGNGCPVCAANRLHDLYCKSHENYIEDVASIDPNIIVLDKYVNSNTNIRHYCKNCHNEWITTPNTILHSKGCPFCSGYKIGAYPEYKNSIWSSEYRDYFSQFMSDDQMKTNMPQSNTKVSAICPNCHRTKMVAPCVLLKWGLSCICSNRQSFPNRFVYNVLQQLNIKSEPEYTPKWSEHARYDEYLVDYNIIIENHGRQHYEECTLTQRTLLEERRNDEYKQKLAFDNNIEEYIVLDCRESTMKWIKHSIMTSKLPLLLNFVESDINWKSAEMDAHKNTIKIAADMYNNGYTIKQIADNIGVTDTSVRIWLHKATELQWCIYIPYKHKIST